MYSGRSLAGQSGALSYPVELCVAVQGRVGPTLLEVYLEVVILKRDFDSLTVSNFKIPACKAQLLAVTHLRAASMEIISSQLGSAKPNSAKLRFY